MTPLPPHLSDFRNFVFLLWEHLNLPAPTPVQYDICSYLGNRKFRRRMVQAFRGVGKSWLTAAYVLWRLCLNPNERILVVSANEDRATQFSTFVRRLIDEWPMVQHLRPGEGQRDSVLAFDVAGSMPHQSPSLRAAGITGQITGGRASIIVADDVEVPKNSLTQVMRDKLAESVKEFDAILMSSQDLAAIGLPAGEIVYLGTPQTEMTVYGALEGRGYNIRIWPARYPDSKRSSRYGNRLAPMLREALGADPTLATQCSGRGAPTDPTRFDDLDLMEREASYGRSGFAMQFMLDPSLSDMEKFPLKLADLVVMDLDPKLGPVSLAWGSSPDLARNDLPTVGLAGDRLYRPIFVSKENYVPYTGTVMAIDPAGRGGDELGYAIISHLNGRLFLHRCRGLKGGYVDSNLQHLADEAKKFGVNHVVIEPNFGDGMFLKLLLPFMHRTHPCLVEETPRSSAQKERRIIDTLEPVMNQHRLVVSSEVVKGDFENYNDYPNEHFYKFQLFYQMTRITRDKGSLSKDDRLDALALAVAYWIESLAKDADAAEMAHLEELRQKEIDAFIDRHLGGRSEGWASEFFDSWGREA